MVLCLVLLGCSPTKEELYVENAKQVLLNKEFSSVIYYHKEFDDAVYMQKNENGEKRIYASKNDTNYYDSAILDDRLFEYVEAEKEANVLKSISIELSLLERLLSSNLYFDREMESSESGFYYYKIPLNMAKKNNLSDDYRITIITDVNGNILYIRMCKGGLDRYIYYLDIEV